MGGGGSDPDNTENNQGGGGMDPTAFVKANSPVMLGEGADAGMMIARMQDASGQTAKLHMAIVADGGDVWHVETVNEGLAAMSASMPDLKGMIVGMVVNKEDGKVTKAMLGKPGEAGKEIEIIHNDPVSAEAPDGVAEDVTIGLGTFPAMKYANEGGTSWVGNGGDLDGVSLKLEVAGGGAGSYELSEMPSTETLDIGGTSVKATKFAYSNGNVTWTTENAVITALNGGLAKMTSANYSVEVTEVSTSAEPQLKWE